MSPTRIVPKKKPSFMWNIPLSSLETHTRPSPISSLIILRGASSFDGEHAAMFLGV